MTLACALYMSIEWTVTDIGEVGTHSACRKAAWRLNLLMRRYSNARHCCAVGTQLGGKLTSCGSHLAIILSLLTFCIQLAIDILYDITIYTVFIISYFCCVGSKPRWVWSLSEQHKSASSRSQVHVVSVPGLDIGCGSKK